MERGEAQEPDAVKAFRAAWEEGNRAWNAHDFRRVYGGFPDDVEYIPADTWPDARPLRGPDEIVAFFEEFCAAFPDVRADLGEVRSIDERTTLVNLRTQGTGLESGAKVYMDIWQLWEVGPEMRPIRVREFSDRESAEAAARGR